MKILQLIILICLSNTTFSQVEFLKSYEFEKDGYYLLGTRSISEGNELANTLGDWYTDDISILNQFKSEWVFEKPGKEYSCGYHYIVYLCKDGLALERFAINLDCNEIVGDKGYFYFETSKLSKFKDDLKKSEKEKKTFGDINSARNYRLSILKDTNLILTLTPNWTKFEGYFNFSYECNDNDEDCLYNEEKTLNQLRTEIQSQYPQEDFELDNYGGFNSEIFIRVKCNKTLEEKFNLYKRDSENEQWEPFKLSLTSYWIKK